MAAAVPLVEVADDADALGAGRPHGKSHARHARVNQRVRADFAIQLKVAAFAKQVQVVLGEHRREAVGIVDDFCGAVRISQGQLVGEGERGARENALVVALGVGAGHGKGLVVAQDVDGGGVGLEGANDEGGLTLQRQRMLAEDIERSAM
jgi:hypothetical protein